MRVQLVFVHGATYDLATWDQRWPIGNGYRTYLNPPRAAVRMCRSMVYALPLSADWRQPGVRLPGLILRPDRHGVYRIEMRGEQHARVSIPPKLLRPEYVGYLEWLSPEDRHAS